MNFYQKLHFLHRAWRYRMRTEKRSIHYLLSKPLSGSLVLDIGANRGIWSYWLHRKVGPTGWVIAFEPQQELVAELLDLRRSFCLNNLEIVPCAASSAMGEATLLRPRFHWGGAKLIGQLNDDYQSCVGDLVAKGISLASRTSERAEQSDISAQDMEYLTANLVTLDGYLAGHPRRPVAFIKCDVEGHELEVFKGGESILQEDRPDLLFECHVMSDPQCEVLKYLEELGYVGYCFAPGSLRPIAEYAKWRPKLKKDELINFIFLPREKSTLAKKAA